MAQAEDGYVVGCEDREDMRPERTPLSKSGRSCLFRWRIEVEIVRAAAVPPWWDFVPADRLNAAGCSKASAIST